MKIAKLLAGVAAVAMMSGVAHADNVYQGSVTNGLLPGVTASGNINGSGLGNAAGLLAVGIADALNPGPTSNTSLITISGGSQGNNGTTATTEGATFTLKGTVSTDCAYYSGNVDTTIDFGTLGIYASDNTGPANAFDMTAPASVTIDTNLAGCNTSNTVTLSKGDIRGLVNNSGVGYDNNVFQANLPYSAVASYTAGPVGSAAPGTTGNWVNLTTALNSASAQHGAWKSAMSVLVNIPVPAKSLVAGSYQDTLKIEIKAL